MNGTERIALALVLATVVSLVGASPALANTDAADLARKAQAVLKTHCYRCHGEDGANEGGVNYVLDRQALVRRKKIVPGQPDHSRLFERVTSDGAPMPPEEEKVRPGKDDIALLRQWIEAGAPAVEVAVARRFLTPADVARLVRDDLEKIAARDRRFVRYFTLTHLHNTGLSADELQSYRHGLSKLVNSLSWGPRVVVPVAIDPDRTLLRIDLRDYQWNEKVWDAILAFNPYGIALADAAAKDAAGWTGTPMPHVRADWFVAAAARPPLYHDVLQLPGSDAELEKMLRVDVAEGLRQGRAARAGFNGSGVSRNNRLIERHESGSVVYWKSHDFAGNTGRRNLFAHPLGPGDNEASFEPDGGEIIFNLPNGLQAYFLVDAEGRRIDKAPTAIVSDPRSPDRSVENGISCMACHARGLIDKKDQVRDHVLANARSFTEADLETVRTLYPPRETFAALVRKDAERFQQAVVKTGAPLSATEPIVALALRFEMEMDRALVAAESGVTPERLLQALDRSPDLARHLGALRVDGGTIQRQVFVDAFADLVDALETGTHLPPRRLLYARLIQRGDRLFGQGDDRAALDALAEAIRLIPDDPRAWVVRGDVLLGTGAIDRAVADYDQALKLDPRSALVHNNRGLAHKRKGDHDKAIDDFTAAIRLDSKLAVAHHNRGAAYHAHGDHDKAIDDYTTFLRLEPGSAIGFNNRGLAHLDKDDADRALADFGQALRLNPKLAVAHNNRGLAHSRKGDLDAALVEFSAALALDPKFARAYFNRAIAHDKKGDAAQARADRERAVRLDPELGKQQ